MAESLVASRVVAPLAGFQPNARNSKHEYRGFYYYAATPLKPQKLQPLPARKHLVFRVGKLFSSSSASTIINDNVDFATEGIDTGSESDTGLSGIGGGPYGGSGDGGGGGDKGDDSSSKNDESSDKGKEKTGLSASQKLTLGYAFLVGIGGVMGFIKSGSQMSLMTGVVSALGLIFVNSQLPIRPVMASSIGLGVSAALLGVMGSRFVKSGKIFPPGVVAFVSLIMTGGYIHGIIRSAKH